MCLGCFWMMFFFDVVGDVFEMLWVLFWECVGVFSFKISVNISLGNFRVDANPNNITPKADKSNGQMSKRLKSKPTQRGHEQQQTSPTHPKNITRHIKQTSPDTSQKHPQHIPKTLYFFWKMNTHQNTITKTSKHHPKHNPKTNHKHPNTINITSQKHQQS